jgi:hypothetical protein
MTKSIIPSARKIVVAVALTLAAGVFLTAGGMFIFQQSYRLQNRTIQERQFRIGTEWWETDLSTIREFEKRHELDPEAKGGLRLAIDEWPDWRYLISLETSGDGSAKGAIRAIAYDGKGPVYENDFQLEMYEARLFFDSFDQEIDGYWGTTTACTDGTSFQFERWSEEAVSSGAGNAACQPHHAELMSLVAETLFVPLHDVPFDWRSWFSAKRYLKLPRNGS